MKILIVGAGGIGGFFGAKLIQAGADITFLLRDKRKALIDASGLTIETPKGDFTVRPKTLLASDLRPEYDLIILAPKAYDFEDALHSVSLAASHGVFLPFLNGLDHLELLDQRYGVQRVLGGVAMLPSMITPSGSIKQLFSMNKLIVGARAGGPSKAAQAFVDSCQGADFECTYSAAIEQSLWDKWVFLATMATLTTQARASVGEIVSSPYGASLFRSVYNTCCNVARASGFEVSSATQEGALAMLTQQGSPASASMLRDLLSGQRTEHAHILGAMIDRARAKGVGCELLQMAFTQLYVADEKRKQVP